ncbi:MAG: hypothetical protein M0R50_10965 [Candidatus Cloacimonetes bacterium]|jgi:hypothetical protein|nr:hypothetical protein [Candidatus Cloacimonadota bacterium]
MLLTSEEISVILLALQDKYGFGYNSDTKEGDVKIGQLKAKLSIMGEMASKTKT